MKHKAVIMLFLISQICLVAGNVKVIPEPYKITEGKSGEVFTFSSETAIIADKKCAAEAAYLAKMFKVTSGFELKVNEKAAGNVVEMSCSEDLIERLGKEGYLLAISTDKISIQAASPAGVFYACQTIRQLLPPEVDGVYPVKELNLSIPTVKIEDKPRFEWRGYMLDVSRYFIPMDSIKKTIDAMALYKLNTFHWHLTDYQGWRLQINKYPKLTLIGAHQKQVGLMYKDKETIMDRTPNGGFYTQDEVRELIEYAKARHITVIPEIDVPAHSIAAIAAYSYLSCEGKKEDVRQVKVGGDPTVFCPGKETTFKFLEDVLDEVFALFPESRIHIGGDEVNKAKWKKCPHCRKRMDSEKLKNLHELQSYFIKRVEKYANKKGHTIIGWDEILEGGLAPNAIVMSWRGTKGGIKAAKAGHKVVMTPTSHCYFDYCQGKDRSKEPYVRFRAYLPLSKVYSFDPVPAELNEDEAKFVLGGQANMWCNFVKSPSHVEYMTFPRLCALAEAVWSQKESKDYKRFIKNMEVQYPRLDQRHIMYRKGTQE